jgi:hypothetical protein
MRYEQLCMRLAIARSKYVSIHMHPAPAFHFGEFLSGARRTPPLRIAIFRLQCSDHAGILVEVP